MIAASTALVVVILTLVHAHIEWRDEALADWLGASLHFAPAWWLAGALWLAAVGAILLPLAAAVVIDSRAWWIVAGALLGDAALTHAIPTLVTGRTVPALWTCPYQIVAALLCVLLAPSASHWLALAGVALFAPLRPTLWLLAVIGVLRPTS